MASRRHNYNSRTDRDAFVAQFRHVTYGDIMYKRHENKLRVLENYCHENPFMRFIPADLETIFEDPVGEEAAEREYNLALAAAAVADDRIGRGGSQLHRRNFSKANNDDNGHNDGFEGDDDARPLLADLRNTIAIPQATARQAVENHVRGDGAYGAGGVDVDALRVLGGGGVDDEELGAVAAAAAGGGGNEVVWAWMLGVDGNDDDGNDGHDGWRARRGAVVAWPGSEAGDADATSIASDAMPELLFDSSAGASDGVAGPDEEEGEEEPLLEPVPEPMPQLMPEPVPHTSGAGRIGAAAAAVLAAPWRVARGLWRRVRGGLRGAWLAAGLPALARWRRRWA